MSPVISILNSLPWFAWIPIVAIVCGSVSGVTKMIIVHRERMEMIRLGMNPDSHSDKVYLEEQEV